MMKLTHRSISTLALFLGCAGLAVFTPSCSDEDSLGADGGAAGTSGASTGGRSGASAGGRSGAGGTAGSTAGTGTGGTAGTGTGGTAGSTAGTGTGGTGTGGTAGSTAGTGTGGTAGTTAGTGGTAGSVAGAGTGGSTAGTSGMGMGGANDAGAAGSGEGGEAGSAGAGGVPIPCNGCAVFTVPLVNGAMSNEAVYSINLPTGIDLSGVTITAHIYVEQSGTGGQFGLWVKGPGGSDYHSTQLATLPAKMWTDVIYTPAYLGTFTGASVTNLEFQIQGAVGSAPTTILIDSITFAGAPAAVAPYNFDTDVAVVNSTPYNPSGLAGVSLTWRQ